MTKTYTVGRSVNADIRINDETISSIHLKLTIDDTDNNNGKQVELIDCQSTNGVFLVKQAGHIKIVRQFLDLNAIIALGDYVTTPGQLLNDLPENVKNEEHSESNNDKKNQKDAPFSRYIRDNDGSVRKL